MVKSTHYPINSLPINPSTHHPISTLSHQHIIPSTHYPSTHHPISTLSHQHISTSSHHHIITLPHQHIILLLSEIYFNRNTSKTKLFPQLIFGKPFVTFFYVLRKIAEEYKLRTWRGKLYTVFNFHILSFDCRRRSVFKNRQHDFIEF